MFDLVILSIGFMIHMWALPYSFKNLLFNSIIAAIQLGFGIIVIAYTSPASLIPTPVSLMIGVGVGVACIGFQIAYFRGAKVIRNGAPKNYVPSQLLFLLFFVPTEEIFYRGVFFARLTSIWGGFTAAVLATALSSTLAVVSSRKRLDWFGSAVMGVLCSLGYYYAQSIWAPILIHVGNAIGYEALNEPKDLFD